MQEDNNTKYEPGQKPQAREQVQSKHRQETSKVAFKDFRHPPISSSNGTLI